VHLNVRLAASAAATARFAGIWRPQEPCQSRKRKSEKTIKLTRVNPVAVTTIESVTTLL